MSIRSLGITASSRFVPAPTNTGFRVPAGTLEARAASGYAGSTFQTTLTLDAPAKAFRVILANASTAGTLSFGAVAVGVGDAIDGNDAPTNASWVTGTFGGAVAVDVAAAPAANRPTFVTSDPISLPTKARADGRGLPIVALRGFVKSTSAVGPSVQNNGTTVGAAWQDLAGNDTNGGHVYRPGCCVGDYASANFGNWGVGSGYLNYYPGVLLQLEALHDRRVLNVMVIGDSISEGDTATANGLESYVHYACAAASTPDRPIVFANQGWASQPTQNALDRLSDLIAAGRRPQVVVYCPWSPNDTGGGPFTGPTVDAMRFRLARAIELMQRNGVVPILSTGAPRGFTSAQGDDFRVAFAAEIRALASGHGLRVVDTDAYWRDPANPHAWGAGMNSNNDPLHPGSVAQKGVGRTVLAPMLASLAADYFR